jgi:hypothetical protein
MTSCMVNDPSFMYTHMYSFTDYNGPTSKMCVNKNTLYDYISSTPGFSKFKSIVDRAHMAAQLNECQANFTIMIPRDESLTGIPVEYFQKMDDGLARQILKASTLYRIIDKNILVSSPVSYYVTKNPEMRMYVTNIGGRTRINNCSTILLYNIALTNGMIHIVDNLVIPSEAHFMN